MSYAFLYFFLSVEPFRKKGLKPHLAITSVILLLIGIRDIGNLFNRSSDKDYHKPIKTKRAFNGNYIEYESNGEKDKDLSAKKYLNMIRPYLSDIINYYKAFKNLKVYSINEVFDYETQFGEWKIQLTMSINFISSKDSDETRNMHKKVII